MVAMGYYPTPGLPWASVVSRISMAPFRWAYPNSLISLLEEVTGSATINIHSESKSQGHKFCLQCFVLEVTTVKMWSMRPGFCSDVEEGGASALARKHKQV